VPVAFNSKTFITGMGSPQVLAPMWPLVRSLLDGAVSVALSSVATAIRPLVERHHIVTEKAGAAAVAAGLANRSADGPVVCIVSGGHLDTPHLVKILNGELC
jgi:threonine dehydratase